MTKKMTIRRRSYLKRIKVKNKFETYKAIIGYYKISILEIVCMTPLQQLAMLQAVPEVNKTEVTFNSMEEYYDYARRLERGGT